MSTEDKSSKTNHQEPGACWRLLAHAADGPFEVENKGQIDELVVDDWLHLEQMDNQQWWLRVGDARIWIAILDNGKASVDIERGFYGDVRGTTKA